MRLRCKNCEGFRHRITLIQLCTFHKVKPKTTHEVFDFFILSSINGVKLMSFLIGVSFCLAARYVFCVMGMLGVTVAYVMRACLSIAITQMVKSPEHLGNFSIRKNDVCPDPDGSTTDGLTVLQNVRF